MWGILEIISFDFAFWEDSVHTCWLFSYTEWKMQDQRYIRHSLSCVCIAGRKVLRPQKLTTKPRVDKFTIAANNPTATHFLVLTWFALKPSYKASTVSVHLILIMKINIIYFTYNFQNNENNEKKSRGMLNF